MIIVRQAVNRIIIGIVLLVIVFCTLFWQSYNNKVIKLFPSSHYNYLAQSDSFALGGESLANIRRVKGEQLILDCDIKKSTYAWPFCNITIALSDHNDASRKGLDLRNFSQIRIKMKYANADFKGIRAQLRVFNPNYSKEDKIETWKFLTTEISTPNSNNIYEIPLNTLQVPNWWLTHNKISIEYSGPEFKHAMVLELATGNNIPVGRYEIQIESIELIGKYLNDTQVLYSIIILLTLFLVFYLFMSVKEYKETSERQKQKVLELSIRNKYLASKNSSLKNKVNIDALTGALNRHATEEIFPQLKEGDSIIIMDIDHFKQINDEFGHDAGDDVLMLFARTIFNRLRDNDYFIRWGGEEFLCICPQTSLFDTNNLANSLREVLSEQVWPISKPVTCSFGVAEMVYGESVEMLIRRADSALYQAKNKGRNIVVNS
ncbi:GGDEF domain-containing protein [Thalassotalea sp. LPB0316]|uniref:GGDEF domain-containing protein n=1 Tax=Thalassotalea sp. LPB0316 TaxID=2769490 RepID=UPI00186897D9|nr:GGDEF domain-containing protein [Thalassotalea sp. LPB0316]QOL25577.1 GGDEF domain-containing protein [Thalassotalea sp. LPB0316]